MAQGGKNDSSDDDDPALADFDEEKPEPRKPKKVE